jgi:hypothetical protein
MEGGTKPTFERHNNKEPFVRGCYYRNISRGKIHFSGRIRELHQRRIYAYKIIYFVLFDDRSKIDVREL